jgi:hypothetical protein
MACRNLVDALNAMMDITAREAAVCHLVADGPVPTPLSHHSMISRISTRIASVFSRLKGCSHRFGGVQWHYTGMPHHQQSWTEAEAAALRNHVEPLIQGAMPAPREKLLQIEHKKEDIIDVNGSDSSGSQA